MLHYYDEVSRQPQEVSRLLSHPHGLALDPARPIRFVGIGTSLHACRVAEHWVRRISKDRADVRAEEAHYFALHTPISSDSQIVVVSHRGTKTFPNQVLEKGRSVGATRISITAESETVPSADAVLRTCTADRAATHTVSYTTALTVLAQLVSNTFESAAEHLDAALNQVPDAMSRAINAVPSEDAVSRACRADRLLCVGFGVDAITADEAALKLKEGTYKWADSLTTEFALHGPPASYDASLHAFILEPSEEDAGRTATLKSVLTKIGATFTTIGVETAHADHPDIIIPPCDPLARPLVAVVPLQLTVGAMADALGTNPDSIRTDTDPWAHAMTSYQL